MMLTDERWAALEPLVQAGRPCFLPVFARRAVLPLATACMNRSTSAWVTPATFIPPKSGRMCRSIRLRSVTRVLAFFEAPRRVSSRPASASAR